METARVWRKPFPSRWRGEDKRSAPTYKGRWVKRDLVKKIKINRSENWNVCKPVYFTEICDYIRVRTKCRAFYSIGNDWIAKSCLGRVKRYRQSGCVIKCYQKMKYKVSMGNFAISKKGYDVLTTVTGWGQGFQKWHQTNKSRIKRLMDKCEYNRFSLEWRALMNQPQ